MNRLSDLVEKGQEVEDGSHEEEELRRVVCGVVLEGMVTGYSMATEGEGSQNEEEADSAKRRRLDKTID